MEAWTATRTNFGHWLFSWSGTPTDYFDIWLDGELLETVQGLEYDFDRDGYNDTPPPLEVYDQTDAADAENDQYPPFVVLQWREVSGANAYLVEQSLSGSWSTRRTLMDNSTGWYWYRSPVLDDLDETIYRVSALDERGNAGTAVSYTFEIVRNPAPSAVIYEIDGSGDLVAS